MARPRAVPDGVADGWEPRPPKGHETGGAYYAKRGVMIYEGDIENLRHVGNTVAMSAWRGGALLDLADRLERLLGKGVAND